MIQNPLRGGGYAGHIARRRGVNLRFKKSARFDLLPSLLEYFGGRRSVAAQQEPLIEDTLENEIAAMSNDFTGEHGGIDGEDLLSLRPVVPRRRA